MKKNILLTIIVILLFPLPIFAAEKQVSLADKLAGRILLQVKSYGRAWYISPRDKKRYYLKDGAAAYELMKKLGLGISNRDLEKIPIKRGEKTDKKLVAKLKGHILLQVEKNGEAWYLNPQDGLLYYLADGKSAYSLMKGLSLGISNEDLKKIPMNDSQLTFDPLFNSVAHIKYDGTKFSYGSYADEILPLASLTKLMTALVISDLNQDLQKIITITAEQINYPKNYVVDEITSEIELKAGDKVTLADLWTAMLAASSNQAAGALADSTGLERKEFVKLMNEKAEKLGLKKTKFFEVSGLDSHNVTTPKEMAIIAEAAFSVLKIAETTKIQDYIIFAIDSTGTEKQIQVKNRNYSLFSFNPDAVKTGFLVEAQRNVVLKKGSNIVVVMHALSMKQRNNIIKKLLQ